MKNIFHKLFFAFVCCASITAVVIVSCKKNKDCDVVINIVNGTTSVPVPGATIHMYPPPGTNGNLQIQDQTGATDASGTANFTFKLPAILQADVTPPAVLGLNSGGGLVKLEAGHQVSKTIKIY
ncbi:MAG: hypothetical protein HY063_10280 [Bacteroidetes bacterium]|nr:hypothetical protein [Bacteroidota bacterium]